jgi:hypothetical protein
MGALPARKRRRWCSTGSGAGSQGIKFDRATPPPRRSPPAWDGAGTQRGDLVERALSEARQIGQAAALMYALSFTNMTIIRCGGHQTAKARADELAALAREKGALVWEPQGVVQQGFVLALTGKPPEGVQKIAAGIAGFRSTGSTAYAPEWLAFLAEAYAELGQFDDAWRCISEGLAVVGTTKETWCEAEIRYNGGLVHDGKSDRLASAD